MKTMILTLLVIAAQLAVGQASQTRAPAGQRIVTRTRLVTQFSQLENQLGEALHANNAAGLQQLLSDTFEVWTPEPPGSPIARDEWLQKIAQAAPEVVSIRQMAAKDFGGPVVVNFVLTQRNAGKPPESYFVVDVWTKAGGANQWQLTDRYLAPVHAPASPQHPSPTGKQ